jgi:hypothetical protein
MTKKIFAFSLFLQFVSTVVFAGAPSFNARFYREQNTNLYAAVILDSAGRCVAVAKLDTDHMFPATTKKIAEEVAYAEDYERLITGVMKSSGILSSACATQDKEICRYFPVSLMTPTDCQVRIQE